MTKEYVSNNLRRISYCANFNGLVKHGETYAYSFSEVASQLAEAFYNVRLINIQFMD